MNDEDIPLGPLPGPRIVNGQPVSASGYSVKGNRLRLNGLSIAEQALDELVEQDPAAAALWQATATLVKAARQMADLASHASREAEQQTDETDDEPAFWLGRCHGAPAPQE